MKKKDGKGIIKYFYGEKYEGDMKYDEKEMPKVFL